MIDEVLYSELIPLLRIGSIYCLMRVLQEGIEVMKGLSELLWGWFRAFKRIKANEVSHFEELNKEAELL